MPYLIKEFSASAVLDENDRPVVIGHTTMIKGRLTEANAVFRRQVQEPLKQLKMDNSQFSALINQYELYR